MTSLAAELGSRIGVERWLAWSTEVTVAVDPSVSIHRAAALVRREIASFDSACNRFRPDSEVSELNRLGRTVGRASPVFVEAVATALRAARVTDGAVDPTVGRSLLALGYDRDFGELPGRSSRPVVELPIPSPGWRCVAIDEAERRVELHAGALLDLGATAKALCVDRAARAIAQELDVSVVVDIGGDLAVAGPAPPGGWQVTVRKHPNHDDEQCAVSIIDGGLATSGTSVRRWTRAGVDLHHIVDPTTGWSAAVVWQLVTVAAASCVDANIAATASIVWGHDAPFRIAQFGLPARFLHADGQVIEVGGWPSPTVDGAMSSAEGVFG
jgi:thiamine biosynthesis lipoprotein